MKLEWLIAIIAFVALLVVIAIVAIPQSQDTPTTGSDSEDDGEDGSAVIDVVEEEKTYDISIQNSTFSPENLTLKIGDTVIWTNQEKTPHTLTSSAGGLAEISSKMLDQDQKYNHTFQRAGTFHYHCTLHRDETGIIIVK